MAVFANWKESPLILFIYFINRIHSIGGPQLFTNSVQIMIDICCLLIWKYREISKINDDQGSFCNHLDNHLYQKFLQ